MLLSGQPENGSPAIGSVDTVKKAPGLPVWGFVQDAGSRFRRNQQTPKRKTIFWQ